MVSDFEGSCNAYEELRKKNVQRNEDVMRLLGLCIPTRPEVQRRRKASGNHGNEKTVKDVFVEHRRSARIAVSKQSLLQSGTSESTSPPSTRRSSTSSAAGKPKDFTEIAVEAGVEDQVLEVISRKKEMEEYDGVQAQYSTDASTDSYDEEDVDIQFESRKRKSENSLISNVMNEAHATSSNAVNLDSSMMQSASVFGNQFQELVLRAIIQSTAALIGHPGSLLSTPHGGTTASPLLSSEGIHPASTWNEATYNKCEAQRKRKPKMMRTSAGEDSDSQKDFPVPDNESPQQKSLRTRRLNRSRGRRAKELSNNRKALNKLPYVLHVDGTGKARGIHKHQWRAAVRGQCGRLDPTMDNINHHPKHVVDSIWHALEKEWEFEGFAHRAREMFEKSATKFMRNRKMQLKYKCQKNVDGSKPDDVNGVYWSKIKDMTKKSRRQSVSTGSRQTTTKGKEQVQAECEEERQSHLLLLENEENSGRKSPDARSKSDSVVVDDDDVDAKIRMLQSELLRLQKTRKEGGGRCNSMEGGQKGAGTSSNSDLNGMKESMSLWNENSVVMKEASSKQLLQILEPLSNSEEKRPSVMKEALAKAHEVNALDDINDDEMDCGDVVRLFAINGGVEKEVGKGILMGHAGSKFARKVIPKGWKTVKVTSFTFSGAAEICPFPMGWGEQVKQQTVKEANGRTILWPDTLIHSLLHM